MGNETKLPKEICRTMYCPKCAVRALPQKKQRVLLYGSNRKGLHAAEIQDLPEKPSAGCTPHYLLDIRERVENGVVKISFQSICSIEGCGWELSTLGVNEAGHLCLYSYAHFIEGKVIILDKLSFCDFFLGVQERKLYFKVALIESDKL